MSGDTSRAFDPRIIGAVIVAGIVGFIGYWLLTAFSPELGTGRNGGGHALSRSAVSYSALVEIARRTGRDVTISRSTTDASFNRTNFAAAEGLLILTPTFSTSAEDLRRTLGEYDHGDILIVLPKWRTEPDPRKRGWVRRSGSVAMQDHPLLEAIGEPEVVDYSGPVVRGSGEAHDERFTLLSPGSEAVILTGTGFSPVVPLGKGALVGVLPQEEGSERHVFLLADPDILSNHGLTSPARADAALAMLDAMGGYNGITFDVTLNGLGSGGRSLLRLAFTPPFLGLTLCLLVAALLGLWQGFVRFGPPWQRVRAVALGKAALVANSAALIVQARRVSHFAARYAAMVREAAARRLHAPANLTGGALDAWLDRFRDSRGETFSGLARTLENSRNPEDCVKHAAALGKWRKDILRDSE